MTTVDFLLDAHLDVFASFSSRYPDVGLTVCSSYDELSLRRREADVALRLSDAPAEHLVGRRLGAVGFGLYAARALIDRIGESAPLEDFPSGDDVLDCSRVNQTIEQQVRDAPEQYLWLHQRFKTRPEGEPSLYARG